MKKLLTTLTVFCMTISTSLALKYDYGNTKQMADDGFKTKAICLMEVKRSDFSNPKVGKQYKIIYGLDENNKEYIYQNEYGKFYQKEVHDSGQGYVGSFDSSGMYINMIVIYKNTDKAYHGYMEVVSQNINYNYPFGHTQTSGDCVWL